MKTSNNPLTYDHVIIFNFVNKDIAAFMLANRYIDKNIKCEIISGSTFMHESALLSTNAKNIKIYIMAHCTPESDYASAISLPYPYNPKNDVIDLNSSFSYQDLAKKFSQYIGNNPVTFNLIMCAAASGSNLYTPDQVHKSFAAKFHQEISKYCKRDITVIARNQITGVTYKGVKDTYPINLPFSQGRQELRNNIFSKPNLINKQFGSKLIFTQGVIHDAYYTQWKSRVLKKLESARDTTTVPLRKEFLARWLELLDILEPDQIANELKKELSNKNSTLLLTSFLKSFLNTSEYNLVSQLYQEYKSMMDSPYTFTESKKIN